jgi:hypothetical protein
MCAVRCVSLSSYDSVNCTVRADGHRDLDERRLRTHLCQSLLRALGYVRSRTLHRTRTRLETTLTASSHSRSSLSSNAYRSGRQGRAQDR